MKEKDIRKTEARTFLAEQAVELGLADEVASFEAVLSAFVRDLNPVYRVSPTGAVQMSTENAPASGVTLGTTPRIEGLQEALSRAREDGRAAMKAEMQTEVVNAYIRGRTDAAAIVSHEAAQGRTAAAAKMAGNGKLSVEEAVEMLSAIPVSDTASSFRAKLASDDPKVPAAAASQGSALGPISDFQQSVASHVSAILSAPRVR
jgi:hypothetical protein